MDSLDDAADPSNDDSNNAYDNEDDEVWARILESTGKNKKVEKK